MRNNSESTYFKTYILSEFHRIIRDRNYWLSILILIVLGISVRFFSLIQSVGGTVSYLIPFSGRAPAYLKFIQSDFDTTAVNYPLFLFIFPIINSIIYVSSLKLEARYGIAKNICVKIQVYNYFLAKLLISFALSFLTLMGFYFFDAIIAAIIYPLTGTGFFTQGDIFRMASYLNHHSSSPQDPYLSVFSISVQSALSFALLSVFTCSLSFLTGLKHAALLISGTFLCLLSSLFFDTLSIIIPFDVRNLSIGRLTYFYLNSSKGISPEIGLIINALAVSVLIIITFNNLKANGDRFRCTL